MSIKYESVTDDYQRRYEFVNALPEAIRNEGFTWMLLFSWLRKLRTWVSKDKWLLALVLEIVRKNKDNNKKNSI